jgi:hypothetical protein
MRQSARMQSHAIMLLALADILSSLLSEGSAALMGCVVTAG